MLFHPEARTLITGLSPLQATYLVDLFYRNDSADKVLRTNLPISVAGQVLERFKELSFSMVQAYTQFVYDIRKFTQPRETFLFYYVPIRFITADRFYHNILHILCNDLYINLI